MPRHTVSTLWVKHRQIMSEYVVSFKTCMQVSPDDWDTITPSLKVTDSTTIKEIRDWYLSKNRGATSVGNLNIVELDKTAPPVEGI